MSTRKLVTKKVVIQDLTNSDVRNLFFANSFDLPPGINPCEKFPKGYFSFLEACFTSSNILSKTNENLNNYVAAIDKEEQGEKKAEKFFRNMVRFCTLFDETSSIEMITVQKAGVRNNSNYLKLPELEKHLMRMIICVRDETSTNYNHLEIESNGQKIQIPSKKSFATVVFYNMSKIQLSISEEKPNSRLKIAESFYIIIDFDPSPEMNERALGKIMDAHPMKPKNIIKRLSKNATALKNKFADKIPDLQSLMQVKTSDPPKNNFAPDSNLTTNDFE